MSAARKSKAAPLAAAASVSMPVDQVRELLSGAGAVLFDAALTADMLGGVLSDLIGQDLNTEAGVAEMLEGVCRAIKLCEQMGCICDRGAQALGASCVRDDADEWLLSPVAARGLASVRQFLRTGGAA